MKFSTVFKAMFCSFPLLLSGCSGVEVLNKLAEQDKVILSENILFDKKKSLYLDVYQPKAVNAIQSPVIIFYWGGRWQEGDKTMYQFVGRELAKRGIVTVIPNYRLWPKVGYKGFLQDSVHAVKWVKQNIEKYGGDANQVFAMGHSAGAYNAVMLGLNNPFLKNPREVLSGVIGISGPYDFLPFTSKDLPQIFGPAEEFTSTQPINWVDGKNSPLLLIHSLNDDIVYPKNTKNLARKIKQHGGQVETLYLKELSHPMMIGVVSNLLSWKAPTADRIESFVKETHQK